MDGFDPTKIRRRTDRQNGCNDPLRNAAPWGRQGLLTAYSRVVPFRIAVRAVAVSLV